MQQISNEQWNLYLQKYEKLMWTISRKISGDPMTASIEDNFSDLCIAALNSISAYERKTGQGFDEAFGTKLFDQYTKTVLWNYKAKKGVPLTNKMDFRNKHFSINMMDSDGEESSFDIEDTSSSMDLSSLCLDDMFEEDGDNVRAVIKAIIEDPSVITSDGKLKSQAIVRSTKMSVHFVERAIDKIKYKLDRVFNNES